MTTMPSATSSRLAGLFTALGVCAIPFALALSARGDTVKMPNGETLQGTIVQDSGDFVLFRSASFGEIKIPRTSGIELARTSGALADAAKASPPAAPAAAPPRPVGAPPPPPPSLIKTMLGLSDRWSAELDANLLLQEDTNNFSSRGAELTIGYKVPNEIKPTQPLHDYGLFGAYKFQKVNDSVVGQSAEMAFRYFYQPISRWLFLTQADWTRDRINGIDSRSQLLAISAYRFVDTQRTRFFAGIGPSYLADSLIISTSPTTSLIAQERGFRVAFYELIQHQFTPSLSFRQTLVVFGRPDNPSGAYNMRFIASLRRMLTPNLSFSPSYDWVSYKTDYILPPGARGPLERRGTLKLMFGYRL